MESGGGAGAGDSKGRNEVVNGLWTESCAQSCLQPLQESLGPPAGSADPAAAAWGGAWHSGRDSRGQAEGPQWGGQCGEAGATSHLSRAHHPTTDERGWHPRAGLVPVTPPTPTMARKSSPRAPGSRLLSRLATKEPPVMRSHIQIRMLSRHKSMKGPDSWDSPLLATTLLS